MLAKQIKNLSRRLFDLMAQNRSLVILSLLGLLCGALVGLLMVAFEWGIVALRQLIYFGDPGLDFGLASDTQRWATPVIAMLVLGVAIAAIPATWRFTGVAHVIDRIVRHDAILPLRNAIVQGLGAMLALASGMAVGREGPAVHMGAAIASTGGRFGLLPVNTNRVLVACGTAAAVAASFNTPLAGVILAMEVVLMEYSIIGFAPVILSAVSATAVALLFHDNNVAFYIPHFSIGSLTELRWLAVTGVVVGIAAALFVMLIDRFGKLLPATAPFSRIALAGVITGLLAWYSPLIMGVGYPTVNLAFTGQLTLDLALIALACKMIASAAAVGLGVPGGVIGPTLVIGALLGLVMGHWGQELGIATSPVAFYALVGVGAMMCATLHAPLAALTAILELTGNREVILPGMFVLIIAYLVNKSLFKSEPLFLRVLSLRGQPWIPDARLQGLQKVSVAKVAERKVTLLSSDSSQADIVGAIEKQHWLVVDSHLIDPGAAKVWLDIQINDKAATPFDIHTLTDAATNTATLKATASLYTAWAKISRGEADTFIVLWRDGDVSADNVLGVITTDIIRGYADLEYCPLPPGG